MTVENNPPQPLQPHRRRPRQIWIVIGAITLVLVVVVIFLIVRFLLPAQPPQYPSQALVPSALRDTQVALTTSYGWVSKPTGAARIPVDRAMQIIATQGFPTLVEVPGVVTPQPTAPGAGAGGGPGAQLFTSLGCSGCHMATNGPIAPTLHGVYGSQVQLSDGSTVTANDAYIRESILSPTAQVVKGFNPVMPSFQGKVTDAQITDLINYIKTLK